MESHGLRTPRIMAGDGFRVAIQRKDLEYGAFLSICLTGAE